MAYTEGQIVDVKDEFRGFGELYNHKFGKDVLGRVDKVENHKSRALVFLPEIDAIRWFGLEEIRPVRDGSRRFREVCKKYKCFDWRA